MHKKCKLVAAGFGPLWSLLSVLSTSRFNLGLFQFDLFKPKILLICKKLFDDPKDFEYHISILYYLSHSIYLQKKWIRPYPTVFEMKTNCVFRKTEKLRKTYFSSLDPLASSQHNRNTILSFVSAVVNILWNLIALKPAGSKHHWCILFLN